MADGVNARLSEPVGAIAASLDSARRVLDIEIAGLRSLRESLDGSFDAAIALLEAVSGRMIVTGMGKSGHVAHKIAATLASTGAPAQYVHPAEASHGDLGMITVDDAVIALSNSGETPELSDIIAFVKLKRIPLVSITGRADSTLARAADVSLVIPDSAEACPLSLAPTTSTTVMMALGDAIAVTLLDRRGFSPDDFHMLHPGGQLGSRLIKAVDIMHRGADMPLIDRDRPMSDAILEMTAKRLGCVGVLDPDGSLAGIVTDGDLRRNMDAGLLSRRAGEVMTAQPKTVGTDILAAQVFGMMNENKITNVFIVSDGKPVGVVHIHDMSRAGIV